MWRKALYGALCWLTLSEALAETEKTVTSLVVKDNVSAESAPRLYRNVPIGVYASTAPYAAFSFQVPAFISAPKATASRIIPVKEQFLLHKNNGYLRDSYGNKYVGTPQTSAYKNAFPQQFVPLQELPQHLTQPLLAAAHQAKQSSPHYFVGSHYRLPTFQVAGPSYGSNHGRLSHPFIQNEHIRNLVPVSTLHTQVQGATVAQQQPSINKALYSDGLSVEQFKIIDGPKSQRLEHRPERNYNAEANVGVLNQSYDDKAQIQAAAAKTAVTAIVNGQKTVINVDTKPPVPLLDLSLLEPLTFANPLVPQVQHFLPRINEATYHKLPELSVNQDNDPKKELVIKKTKIYDNGYPRKDIQKKNPKQPAQYDNNQETPVQPKITVQGKPNIGPEIIYEINKPNYKETYKEQSISYNKETQSEPLHYNYDKKAQAEPVHYSYEKTDEKPPVTYNFVHSSRKVPVDVTQRPRQLIYMFHNGHPSQSNAQSSDAGSSEDTESSEDNGSSEDSGSIENTNEEGPVLTQNNNVNHERHNKSPQIIYKQNDDKPEHREQEYYHKLHGENHHRSKDKHQNRSNKQYHINHKENRHKPNEQLSHKNRQYHHEPNEGHEQRPNDENHHRHQHRSNGGYHPRPKEVHHHKPIENYYHHIPNEEGYHKFHKHPHSQLVKGPIKPSPQYQEHISKQYEEDIHLEHPLQTASIKVDPAQHVQLKNPKPGTVEDGHHFLIEQKPGIQFGHGPIIHEKAKRIIIKEESPEEKHIHQEQIMAEVIDQEDNKEEDFENAYKNAAIGFEAFEKKAADIERDIYDPASYGNPPQGFDLDKTPFHQYHAEGETFPKSSRLSYKDDRDNTKEDYYLMYSANKPESLSDRYKNKANYYKLYKAHKPEKFFGETQDKKKAKYISSPSYNFEPTPKQKSNGYFAQYKNEPDKYEYDYSEEMPRDNSAHASRPYQRLKSRTHFVEPQFQYGFEPVALPRLLDSELAAMASNDSPESEKPGMRKKIYQENWYIKKTSTSGSDPS